MPRTELILFLQNQPRHDSLSLLSFPEVADVMSAFSCQLVGDAVVGVGSLWVVTAYFPISAVTCPFCLVSPKGHVEEHVPRTPRQAAPSDGADGARDISRQVK